MIQKVHKTNPYELSGLVQKEMRLLHDEQIKFRLFFSHKHKHSSTVVVNGS